MKKIFTILLAVGFVSVASAQRTGTHNSGTRNDDRGTVYTDNGYSYNDRDNDNDNRGYNNGIYNSGRYSFTLRQKQMEITKINRQFDQQLFALNSRRIRSYDRNMQIRLLEKQRSQQIRMVEARFANMKNRDYVVNQQRGNRW